MPSSLTRLARFRPWHLAAALLITVTMLLSQPLTPARAAMTFAVTLNNTTASAQTSFGQNVIVKANVFAPNGTVWLKKGTDGLGAFIGKRVQIGENVTLTLDSGY